MYPSNISEELFNVLDVELMFVKTCKPRIYKPLDIFNGIMYILRTDCQWNQLPNDFPPFKSVNYYYNKWNKSGLLDHLLMQVNAKARIALGLCPRAKMGVIDSSSVQNSDIPNISGRDGHKKIKGIKRFIVTDEIGLVLAVKCTPANLAEVHGAKQLINMQFKKSNWNVNFIIADKGFESKQLQQELSKIQIDFRPMLRINRIKNKSEHHIAVKITSKRKSIAQYINDNISKRRYVVERTFAWMGKYRRLSKNYEQSLCSAEAMIKLFGIVLALRKLESI
jgi:putative transposase